MSSEGLAKPSLLVATGAALGALGTYAYLTRASVKESAAAATASDEAPNTLLEEVRPSAALAKLLPKSALSSTGSIAGHDLLDQLLLAGALRLASAAAETERAEATLSLSVQRSSSLNSEASSTLEPSSPEMVATPMVGPHIKSFEMPAAVQKQTRWQKALRKALAHSVGDPWAQFELHKRPTELCVRWDYDAESNSWQRSETLVKMEDVSFAHGAMRECFRMKKMSQVNAHFFYNMNWEHCNNYVAKRYVKPVDDAVYFDDIKMQMVAKNLSTKFNALHPPKRVDFLHAFCIEVQRGGERLLFCVERAMETGKYVKHNNNSGFVEYGDDGIKPDLVSGGGGGGGGAAEAVGKLHRATPHAFSRFTFEATKGELMVVDIQGVDDLFTDPQIHSLKGDDFGDGNLGAGGMALFFSTSEYDSLCARLGLTDFALSAAERRRISAAHLAAMPHVEGGTHIAGAGDAETGVVSPARRQLTGAPTPNGSPLSSAPKFPGAPAAAPLPGAPRRQLTGVSMLSASLLKCEADGVAATSVRSEACKAASLAASRQCVQQADRAIAEKRAIHAEAKMAGAPAGAPLRRPSRAPSEVMTPSRMPSSVPIAEEEDEEGVVRVAQLHLKLLAETADAAAGRANLGLPEIDLATPPSPANGGGNGKACGAAAAALGRVHARLCEYAQSGNLPLQEGNADIGSAAFHMVCAAACGEPRALRDLRALAQGISADELLPGMSLPPDEAEAMGAQHLPMLTRRLAAAGDPDAILTVANGEAAAGRPKQAAAWLQAAVDSATAAQEAAASSGSGMGMGGSGMSSLGASLHVLLEKLGDAQLEAGDPAAAAESLQAVSEAAMEAGKHKLAMKLSMRSEEVAGMVEE